LSFERRDPAYLWDMLDAARRIQRFTSGVSPQHYLQNEMMQSAVERLIEVIGEAARRVSGEFKQAHPEIPWQQIIAQRNVIAHEYGTIIHDRIWQVVETAIPELIVLLEPLIPPLPQEKE
jgi:uncharacterized protein with HEPN domain